jgi:sugar phosphate isomerase/epimerase
MYKALSPGAIHVSVKNLDEAIAAAKIGGFEGVEFNPSEVADLIDVNGAEFVRDKFAAAGIKPAGWGLPTEWRGEKETFQESLKQLDRLAKASAAIGCHRTATWIMPAGPRVFDENYTFHVNRLSPVAKILADHGIRFGLEFIGPITASRWARARIISSLSCRLWGTKVRQLW